MAVVHDVLVLGAGQAGLALAGECAARGLNTACVAARPFDDAEGLEGSRERWRQSLGAWRDDLGETAHSAPVGLERVLLDSVEAEWAAPCVITRQRGEQLLDRRYAKLDGAALRARLVDLTRARGAFLVRGEATAVEHNSTGSVVKLADGSTLVARLVVETEGTGRFVERPDAPAVACQAAYGELLEVREHPFDQGEMVLMDLRPVRGSRPTDPPTFLYALPLGRNHLFVEETSLISRPAVSGVALRSRLARRLEQWGIEARETLDVEHCLVPMTLPLPDLSQRTLAFGTAASMVHPATGYSVARVIRHAPAVAQAFVAALDQRNDLAAAARHAWGAIWSTDAQRCWELYAFGGRFLTTLDHDRMESWFETFYSLSVEEWGGFFSASQSSSQVARVMTKMYSALDPRARWDLMRAGAGRPGAALLRAALST